MLSHLRRVSRLTWFLFAFSESLNILFVSWIANLVPLSDFENIMRCLTLIYGVLLRTCAPFIVAAAANEETLKNNAAWAGRSFGFWFNGLSAGRSTLHISASSIPAH